MQATAALLIVLLTTVSVAAWSPSFLGNPKISSDRQNPVRLQQPPDDWKLLPKEVLLGDDDDDGINQALTIGQQQQQQQYDARALSQFQSPPLSEQEIDTVHKGNIQTGESLPVRILHSDAGTLELTFPASGITTNAVVSGAFSAAWFSAILPATTMAAAPFLLPFYLAGGVVAKQALVDPFTSTTLSIGRYAWSLRRTRYGSLWSHEVAGGATADLVRAVVVDESGVDTETRQVQYRYELQLIVSTDNQHRRARPQSPVTIGNTFFADARQPAELADTISRQIAKCQSEPYAECQ